ncbi:Ig domain-containing protein, partial [Brucella sp. 21LCYQ03]|nr:Ig domain-containing protein [Brucella sp. 21LCYQ03]
MVGAHVDQVFYPESGYAPLSKPNWYSDGKSAEITGLSDVNNNGRFIHLRGIPEISGSFTYKYINKGVLYDDHETIYITVAEALKIKNSGEFLVGTVGEFYDQQLIVSGGFAPYTWSASGLPAGLKVDGNFITGTPTAVFDGTVTIKVTDDKNHSVEHSFPLRINAREVQITTTELKAGKVGEDYGRTQTLSASG